MSDKDGGPAFPISLPGWGDNGAGGAKLWDYYAAAALSGLAHPMSPEDASKWAANYADVMLAERKKRGVGT